MRSFWHRICFNAANEAGNTWIPEGRSASEELRRPRYLVLAIVVVVVILLQIWLLF